MRGLGVIVVLVAACCVALAPEPVRAAGTVVPTLTCVEYNGSAAQLISHFGYVNTDSTSVTALVGADNFFTPSPSFQGQPVTFQPGTFTNVFTVTTNVPPGTSAAWTLLGSTVTATNDPASYCLGNSTAPTVTGTPQIGSPLAADPGSWYGLGTPTFAYQWQYLNSGTYLNITGANGDTYTPVSADLGRTLRVQISATNSITTVPVYARSAGTAAVAAVPFPAPSVTTAPSVSGSPQPGNALTCDKGTWLNATSYAYAWLRNGSPIGGAASSTYTVQSADSGTALQCQITATGTGGSTAATSTPLVGGTTPAPSNTAAPSISGTPGSGSTLTCDKGTWSDATSYAYAWLQDGSALGGATASTYTVQPGDVGTALQCQVTATGAGGSTVALTTPTVVGTTAAPSNAAAPSISGTATPGGTLTCNRGTWTGATSFAYAWLRNGSAIGSASATYTVQAADSGKALQCKVTATGAGGSAAATSSPDVVAPAGTTPAPSTSSTSSSSATPSTPAVAGADTSAPTAPARLAGRMRGTSLVLRWLAAGDDRGVAAYRVERNGIAVTTVAALSAIVQRVKPGDVIDVRAVDAAGNASQASNTLTISRRRAPAGVPKRIPAWAWQMLAWNHTPVGQRGPRPAHAPRRLPRWYWSWAAWRLAPLSASS